MKPSDMRAAEVVRNTKETQIRVKLDLDGRGEARLSTGLPFLEHMLDQVARHSMLDLEIEAKGDLHIDAHHTVEDIGITLGQACARAIGDKAGVRRFGHAYVPLDEALSYVAAETHVVVTAHPARIRAAERVVVPGQGALPDGMRQLQASGARDAVISAAHEKPFLGLCIGMQMLFEHGEEGDTPGLGL